MDRLYHSEFNLRRERDAYRMVLNEVVGFLRGYAGVETANEVYHKAMKFNRLDPNAKFGDSALIHGED